MGAPAGRIDKISKDEATWLQVFAGRLSRKGCGRPESMARKGSVLEFRRPKRKFLAQGPRRGNKLRFSRRGRSRASAITPARTLFLLTAISLLLFASVTYGETRTSGTGLQAAAATVPDAPVRLPPGNRLTSRNDDLPELGVATVHRPRSADVRWVDGDSGWIDGREFRLFGVDAPEGSPSRARCQQERTRSRQAREAAHSLTSQGDVAIRGSMGTDKYGRELLLLTVDGKDVAAALVGRGHLKYWAYEAGQKKPDWCS